MIAFTTYVGITRRNWGHPRGPLRHWYTNAPASRFGRNKLARCRASILPHPYAPDGINAVEFDPDHPRACTDCARLFRERHA